MAPPLETAIASFGSGHRPVGAAAARACPPDGPFALPIKAAMTSHTPSTATTFGAFFRFNLRHQGKKSKEAMEMKVQSAGHWRAASRPLFTSGPPERPPAPRRAAVRAPDRPTSPSSPVQTRPEPYQPVVMPPQLSARAQTGRDAGQVCHAAAAKGARRVWANVEVALLAATRAFAALDEEVRTTRASFREAEGFVATRCGIGGLWPPPQCRRWPCQPPSPRSCLLPRVWVAGPGRGLAPRAFRSRRREPPRGAADK